MARYAQNLFYVGMDQQDSKGTSVVPVYFPEYFDGDISVTPEMDQTQYTAANSQYNSLGLIERVRVPINFTALATPQIAALLSSYTLGKEQIKGTQPGSPNSTTLDANVSAGATVLSVTDETGFAADEYIQLVSTSDTYEDTGEIRQIASTSTGQITVSTAISYGHSNGDTVEEVVLPFSHKSIYEAKQDMPWFSTEASVGFDSANQTDPLLVRAVDCRVASNTISVESGMPLMFNPTIQAIDIEKIASETAESFESNDPLIMHQGTYTVDSGSTTHITDFSLELTNILDEDDFTITVKRSDLPVTRREGTLSFTLKLQDGTRLFDTYMNDARDDVLQALKTGDFNVVFDNGVTGTGNRSITIDIPNLDHVSAEVNPGIGDGTLEYSCETVLNKGSSNEFLTVVTEDDNQFKYIV